MNEQPSFIIHELVWAKVQHYPWWPAKIANRLRQNSKTVYKLKFFGDSSSCYLHSDNIAKFLRFDVDQQILNCKDLKLKKSIQLAKAKHTQHKNEECDVKELNPQTPITQEDTQIESKEHSCLLQKMIMEQPLNAPQSSFKEFFQMKITSCNVLDVLRSYSVAKKNIQRGSLNRKQLISFESNLKQNLLLKYNLNFHLQNQIEINDKNNNFAQKKVPLRKRKFIAKLKKRHEPNELSCRKLHQVLSTKLDPHLSRKISVQILKRLQEQSSGNKNIFSSNYMKTIQRLSSMKQTPLNIEQIVHSQYKQNDLKDPREQNLCTEAQTGKDQVLNS